MDVENVVRRGQQLGDLLPERAVGAILKRGGEDDGDAGLLGCLSEKQDVVLELSNVKVLAERVQSRLVVDQQQNSVGNVEPGKEQNNNRQTKSVNTSNKPAREEKKEKKKRRENKTGCSPVRFVCHMAVLHPGKITTHLNEPLTHLLFEFFLFLFFFFFFYSPLGGV